MSKNKATVSVMIKFMVFRPRKTATLCFLLIALILYKYHSLHPGRE